MKNAKSNTISSRTLTAAMLVLGMSFGSAAALAPATADAASAAKKETRFKLAVSGDTKVKKGKKATVTVTLTADNPWHMNTDFPTGLTLDTPSGVKLAKKVYKKKDAATLSEHKIEYRVEVTGKTVGKQKVTGTIKFAICKQDSCSPAKAAVNIPLTVTR